MDDVPSVCATCLAHPRLQGLATGAAVLVAIHPDGPRRCLFCGMLLASRNNESGATREG